MVRTRSSCFLSAPFRSYPLSVKPVGLSTPCVSVCPEALQASSCPSEAAPGVDATGALVIQRTRRTRFGSLDTRLKFAERQAMQEQSEPRAGGKPMWLLWSWCRGDALPICQSMSGLTVEESKKVLLLSHLMRSEESR